MTLSRTPLRRHAVVAALTLALIAPTVGTATAHASPSDGADRVGAARATSADAADTAPLRLPRPTGPYAVGRDTLHLVDESRRDPWVPSAGARELMVSVHYPGRHGGGHPVPYTSEEEARLSLEAWQVDGQMSPAAYSSTRTFARSGTRPAPGRFPLVVLSPGFTAPRSTLTHLAEDLASRGFVVATVDHAYESVGTAFPGGRMLTCQACAPAEQPGMGKVVTEGRAKDLSYVIDRLTGGESSWRHARMIDGRRIGAGGHSIGGAAALATMTTDPRVRAGLNMDGSFHTGPDGIDGRPFLMLGTEAEHTPGHGDGKNWDRTWQGLDGWKRWLTVRGSGHFTFTDLPVLAGQAGVVDPEVPLSGERSQEITRTYVGAFFEQWLRGEREPLLDGPAARHPEVVFQGVGPSKTGDFADVPGTGAPGQ
ncbi:MULTISPECIES: alpha/beta hydrolase family protein [Streptomyces]|uniref:alpha/beta hydrolase family protein n=1 Tax=Streptomyces TaxID=1883 RepID=UPI001E46352F|nr:MULTISPECIES: alpha/beta hydrolase [Streptomyces]UFQ13790.1 alpha/beta hydrolase [Streptomyces huasconensis]WCL83385.1 alpha/beta hydrolase [Streptomyces sp. JCM 35825]